MPPRMLVLAIPAALVVTALIVHSLRTRGRNDTLLFFGLALLFGILRGNVIWWITTQHFEGEFPYIFAANPIGVFHDSLVADLGWILCLYLGSAIATSLLASLPHLQNRLFAIVGLACLFNGALSYAVEATAIEMRWWDWSLSTESDWLRDVPIAGIEAWFSVGFDFLIPYFLIRHYRKSGQWWPYLSLLIFPLHMATHLSNTRISTSLPMTPYNVWYWGMALVTMILPFSCKWELRRPWLAAQALPLSRLGPSDSAPWSRLTRWIPPLGLAVVLAVLVSSDLLVVRMPELLITKAALIYLAVLAFTPIRPWIVLVAAGILAAIGGKLLVPPLVVPAYYLALRGSAHFARWPLLKPAYALIPLLLTWSYWDWSVQKDALDRRYRELTELGRQAAASRRIDEAIDYWRQATELKPKSVPAWENLMLLYTNLSRLDEAEQTVQHLLELRPSSEEYHANLGGLYLLRGRLDESERWFRRALELDEHSEYSRQMLAQIARLRAQQDSTSTQR